MSGDDKAFPDTCHRTVDLALEAGFTVEAEPRYFMSMATLFNRALKAA